MAFAVLALALAARARASARATPLGHRARDARGVSTRADAGRATVPGRGALVEAAPATGRAALPTRVVLTALPALAAAAAAPRLALVAAAGALGFARVAVAFETRVERARLLVLAVARERVLPAFERVDAVLGLFALGPHGR